MKKKVIFFSCLMLVLGLKLITGSDYKELKFVREISTNTNDNLYFKYVPNSFDVDSQGNIYIVVREFSKIFKVSLNGKLLKEIGMSGGLGPGDITRPEFISVDKDKLAVTHIGLISFFKTDGTFINRFKKILFIHSMYIHQGRLYCLQPYEQVKPIIVYNQKGRMLKNFGEVYPMNMKIHKVPSAIVYNELNNGFIVKDHDLKRIYFVSSRFGDVFVYDSKGKFEKKVTLDIKKDKQKEIRDFYFKQGIKYDQGRKNMYETKSFINAASLSEALYLLYYNNDKRLKYGEVGVIDPVKLNNLGSLRYYNPADRKTRISEGMHMVVKNISGKEYFFISCYDYKDDEPKIMIFEK